MRKLSEEEKILREATRSRKPKQTKSESELVHEYVDRVIRGKQSRGHVDSRFAYTKANSQVNKEMWLDTDFFFSVVFQSADQKYQFLKRFQEVFKFELENFEGTQVQIVNGLKLGRAIGIELKKEEARDYPYASLDLRPYVLDDEQV